ncbi:helix-turn-helix domain containing protein [Pseudomonas sp. LS1212]|uniref:helix-turn-helix domain containing protein n=1 Tax=Pseudomonas sp. LS1212 TaxID=2972478 RepID=UPI00215BBCAE|nr:helix-turn-helix domain containing protein [Pseudomonas sp. LS1212]UVJ46626.1 helix-turn-helix domain containing protein [Pseudomonas sp. LS1212]
MSSKGSAAVLARLKLITDSKTDMALSIILGISPQTLSSWKGRESIPYAICIDIAEQHGISLDWLLTGTGPRLREDHQASSPIAPDNASWEIELLNQLRALSEVDKHSIQLAVQEKKRILDLERRLEALTSALALRTPSA